MIRRLGRPVYAALVLLIAVPATISCARRHPQVTTIPIEGRPSALALAAGRVWVTDDANASVHVIDPDAAAESGRPIGVRSNPVAIASARGAVWVAHASGYATRIDARTRRVTRTVRTGGSLTGITIASGAVWATDLEANDLVEIQPRDGRVVDRIHVRDGAVRVCFAKGSLFVTGSENTVTRIDPSGVHRRRSFRVGLGPIGIASDGNDVWVANSDDRTVSRVGTSATVRVGRAPVAVAVGGGSIWAADQDDATVTRIDQRSLSRRGTIPLKVRPRGIVAEGRRVWVAGTDENAVVRIDPP